MEGGLIVQQMSKVVAAAAAAEKQRPRSRAAAIGSSTRCGWQQLPGRPYVGFERVQGLHMAASLLRDEEVPCTLQSDFVGC